MEAMRSYFEPHLNSTAPYCCEPNCWTSRAVSHHSSVVRGSLQPCKNRIKDEQRTLQTKWQKSHFLITLKAVLKVMLKKSKIHSVCKRQVKLCPQFHNIKARIECKKGNFFWWITWLSSDSTFIISCNI